MIFYSSKWQYILELKISCIQVLVKYENKKTTISQSLFQLERSLATFCQLWDGWPSARLRRKNWIERKSILRIYWLLVWMYRLCFFCTSRLLVQVSMNVHFIWSFFDRFNRSIVLFSFLSHRFFLTFRISVFNKAYR